MLVIRQTQKVAFEATLRLGFEDQLVRHFMDLYPRESTEAGGYTHVAKLVRRGMNRATERGYTGRKETGLFIALMFILGDDFANDPQLPWVARQLNNKNLPLQARPECVFDEAIDFLDATVGANSGFIVRAMLRLRSYELASAPNSSGEEWIDECCDLLEGYYPEKFEYQGAAATRAMVALARERAAEHGFRSNESVMLFAVLMFMMGSGFDNDFLYPWAADALATTGEERERTETLHRAALKHLENSLTPDSQWAQRT